MILAGLNGNWNEVRVKLKQSFALLSESELLLVGFKQDEMLDRIQKKLGKTKEEIRRIIYEL